MAEMSRGWIDCVGKDVETAGLAEEGIQRSREI